MEKVNEESVNQPFLPPIQKYAEKKKAKKDEKCCIPRLLYRLSNNPKLKHAWTCLGFFMTKVILLTADVVTDFETAMNHFSANNKSWGILTLIPIFLPFSCKMIVLLFNRLRNFTMKKDEKTKSDKTEKFFREAIWQLPIFQTVRHLRLFFGIALMDTSIPLNAILMDKLKMKANGLAIFEAFLEATPQFLLQSYIILQTGNISLSQQVGMPISFFSLLNSSIMLFFTQRVGKYAEQNPNWFSKFFVLPFIFLQSIGPVFCLVLLALYLRGYFAICIVLIVALNFLQANLFTKYNTGYQKLYGDFDSDKLACESDKNKIVNIAAFTSWVATSSILAHNHKVKSKFIITTSLTSHLCHLLCISCLFLIISMDETSSLIQYPISHCLTEEKINTLNGTIVSYSNLDYFSLNLNVTKVCWPDSDCDDMVRICREGEQPNDIFQKYLGPIGFVLLFISSIASLCLYYLGNYENVYTLSCGKIVHYTLIQDWIETENYQKVHKVKSHLNDTLINRCDPVEKQTCLHYIVRAPDTSASREVLHLFLELGGDELIKNIYSRTPLSHMSVDHKAVLNLAKQTIKNSRKRIWKVPPMHSMCKNRQNALFTFAYVLGGSINSVDDKGIEALELLFQWMEESLNSPLNNRTSSPYWIISKSDEFQENVLHLAAFNGCYSILNASLDKGISIDKQNQDGNTPTHWAARNGFVDCLMLLISKGADINLQNKNHWTPIHYSSLKCHKDCLTLLIDKGAKVNLATKNGNTPLHIVGQVIGFTGSEEDGEQCCKLLLRAGADWTLKNSRNESPLEYNVYAKSLKEKNPHLFTNY